MSDVFVDYAGTNGALVADAQDCNVVVDDARTSNAGVADTQYSCR